MSEVKILKYLNYLPKVFMVKHVVGQVTKISTVQGDYIDCAKYISKSGRKFSGCYELINYALAEARGIYYISASPKIFITSRGRFAENLNELTDLIMRIIEFYDLEDKRLLINYDEKQIMILDKYVKGQLYQFPLVYKNGQLEIYETPMLKYTAELNFDIKNELIIENYQLKFPKDVEITGLISRPNIAYFMYAKGAKELTIKTPDNQENKVMLNPEKHYLITYLKK
jgi:hypothetical protein